MIDATLESCNVLGTSVPVQNICIQICYTSLPAFIAKLVDNHTPLPFLVFQVVRHGRIVGDQC